MIQDIAPGPDWMLVGEKDPFQALTGPLLQATKFDGEPGELARIGFRVSENHCNSAGPCHGGMIVTFLDLALGLTAKAAGGQDAITPTINLTTDFLAPAMLGDWIESRTRLVRATKRMAFCEGLAIGPNGPVARANGIFRLLTPGG